MSPFITRPVALSAFLLSAACSSGGGQDNVDNVPDVPDVANPVELFGSDSGEEGRAAITERRQALSENGTVLGFGGSNRGATGFRFFVAEETVAEQVIAGATFFPNDDGIPGGGPTSGTVLYSGGFVLQHHTGIGPDADGVFSSGSVDSAIGDLTLEIAFDDGQFEGFGTSADIPDETLDIVGQVGPNGELTGIAAFANISADLTGAVFGSSDPEVNSAAVGVFAGSTDTELLVGGFNAQNRP